jgi:hypothetical protein
MHSTLFQSAYIRVRAETGEDDWSCLTGLQRTDLICCEMYRLRSEEKGEPAKALHGPDHRRKGRADASPTRVPAADLRRTARGATITTSTAVSSESRTAPTS